MKVKIIKARQSHVADICRICSDGWRETYRDILPEQEIESTIEEFYNPKRVATEIESPKDWDGWLVAIAENVVVGTGGGGMIDEKMGEVFVLYVDPSQKRKGIGSSLLESITKQQRNQGAIEQWVSIVPENRIARAFYEKHGFELAGERDSYGEFTEHTSFRLKRQI